jgi:hypothetical protein
MRPGNPGHHPNDFPTQIPQVGLPGLEAEQRIVVEAEPDRGAPADNGLVEHATGSRAVGCDRLQAHADEPAGKLTHDHEDPEGF